jgi:hypothetical protein
MSAERAWALRSGADRGDLAAFCARVRLLDPGGLVRLRLAGERLTAYSLLPLGVLVSRTVHAAEAHDADLTVAAADLLAALEVPRGFAGSPAAAGLVPPQAAADPSERAARAGGYVLGTAVVDAGGGRRGGAVSDSSRGGGSGAGGLGGGGLGGGGSSGEQGQGGERGGPGEAVSAAGPGAVDHYGRAGGSAPVEIAGLDRTRDGQWRGTLPPVVGWRRLDVVPIEAIQSAVRAGLSAFEAVRERPGAATLGESLLDHEALTVTGGGDRAVLPLRVLHAAWRMGFLGAEPRQGDTACAVSVAGRWVRLAAPHGSAYRQGEIGLTLR